MSFNNVESSSGELVCTGTDGYAESEPVYKKEIGGVLIEQMSSDTSIQGETIGSGATNPKWKAFNHDVNDWWYVGWSNPTWIGFKFSNKSYILGSYILTGANNGGTPLKESPQDFEFQGSNDGTNWNTLDVRTNIVWSNGEEKTFDITSSDGITYSHFRVYITEYTGNGGNVALAEIQLVSEDVGSEADFASVKDIVGKFEFENISKATAVDTLVTNELIKNGDTLVLVKDDDSVYEVVASGVTGSGPYEMDTTSVTQGEVPSKAYRVDEGVEFNGVEADVVGNEYSYNSLEQILDILDDESCLAAFNLESDISDLGGTYDGVEDVVTYKNGKFGNGLYMAAHNNSFSVAGLPQMDEFSVTMWINFENANPQSYPGILGPLNGGNESMRSSHNGSGRILVNTGNSDRDTGIETSSRENEWHMWTFQNNLDGFSVTLDNNIEYYEYTDVKTWDTTTLVFGKQTGNNQGFIGMFDQVRIFNKKLTALEINKIYIEGLELKTNRTFEDTSATGSEVVTKVQMSAAGNKMIQLDFDIYKEIT